ncbi:MAG TPA: DUF4097 family beta strand repeat-containing protein [Candidatus Limnocylindria bacterium]
MSEEGRGPEERDWSRYDPHQDEREARQAERDARDAEREAERMAREQARQAERMARDAERQARDAERQARDAERQARHFSHRVEMSGRGVHIGGLDIDGMSFGQFAKSFMKDFASDVSGESFSETMNMEFVFDRMPHLRVRNISGETTIKVGDAGKIGVVAMKHVNASSEDRAKRLLQNLEIRMEKTDDTLVIEPHLYEQERGWVDLFRGKRFRVDFEITVPRECAVDAQTVSGDLSVDGTRGPLEVQSVSGDISVDDVQGPLRLKSVSGDVGVGRYVGHVDGNTVSGDVTFEGVRLRSIQLQTVSGDVEVKGGLESARQHRIRTISGDVQLELVDPDLTVEFRTASGDLESEIAGRVTREGRKEYNVVLGEGRGRALVKTVSGDLSIEGGDVAVPGEPTGEEPYRAAETPESDESTEEVERTQPMGPPPDAQVRSVLERLAKGELNVDDAAAAIDDARKSR